LIVLWSQGNLPREEIMLRGTSKPGEPVRATGIFWVHHNRHRISHQARIKFALFPECATCGDKVRYEIAETESSDGVTWLREDRDFTWAVGSTLDRDRAHPGN
jgi:hypothetical protein